MCEIMVFGESQTQVTEWIEKIAALIKTSYRDTITIIGPSDAPIARIRDAWRKHLFVKTADHTVYCHALEEIAGLEELCRRDRVYLSVTAL